MPAIKIGAKGLRCLDKTQEELNPASDKFNPARVLDVLYEKGEEPRKVMKEYAELVKEKILELYK